MDSKLLALLIVCSRSEAIMNYHNVVLYAIQNVKINRTTDNDYY